MRILVVEDERGTAQYLQKGLAENGFVVRWCSSSSRSALRSRRASAIGGHSALSPRSWKVLYRAQREHRLALTGPYARIRHPQYVGFITILFGFLLQWPTILTAVMFPVLVVMYARLASAEEREMRTRFGEEYVRYAATTPRFIPSITRWQGTWRNDMNRSPRGQHHTAHTATGHAPS
jgi:hypothetical protein